MNELTVAVKGKQTAAAPWVQQWESEAEQLILDQLGRTRPSVLPEPPFRFLIAEHFAFQRPVFAFIFEKKEGEEFAISSLSL